MLLRHNKNMSEVAVGSHTRVRGFSREAMHASTACCATALSHHLGHERHLPVSTARAMPVMPYQLPVSVPSPPSLQAAGGRTRITISVAQNTRYYLPKPSQAETAAKYARTTI